MFYHKKNRTPDESIDRFSRCLVRAAAASDEEAYAAADAPFLYARVRARIARERERKKASEWWVAFRTAAWSAVPAMLVIVLASMLLLFASAGATETELADIFADNRSTNFERAVFDDAALSNDDVLATIIGGENGEDEGGNAR